MIFVIELLGSGVTDLLGDNLLGDAIRMVWPLIVTIGWSGSGITIVGGLGTIDFIGWTIPGIGVMMADGGGMWGVSRGETKNFFGG